jgi:hypothetical protein
MSVADSEGSGLEGAADSAAGDVAAGECTSLRAGDAATPPAAGKATHATHALPSPTATARAEGEARGETGGRKPMGSPPAILLTPNPPTQLSKREEKGLARLRRIDDQIRERATRILRHALRAAELNDDGTPVEGGVDPGTGRPRGWGATAYRVAMDARKPLKTAPGYLAMSARVVESYKRAEAAQRPEPQLGASIQVFVKQDIHQYEVRDVTDVPRRE